MLAARSILLFTGLLFAVSVMVTACETAPPVQEMSDARQAIAVAREAGAEIHATEDLMRAEQYMSTAERELNDENYAEARRNALQAKSTAQAARRASEAQQAQNE